MLQINSLPRTREEGYRPLQISLRGRSQFGSKIEEWKKRKSSTNWRQAVNGFNRNVAASRPQNSIFPAWPNLKY